MTIEEKLKWPNTQCPQRAICMKTKYRWLTCGLRKEFIAQQLIKIEEFKKTQKIMNIAERQKNNRGGL